MYLVALIVVICVVLWQIKNKPGYALTFVILFDVVISLLMYNAGLSGVKLIILYVLYGITILPLILSRKYQYCKSPLTSFIIVYFILVFATNLFSEGKWSSMRVRDVHSFQFQYIIKVVVSFFLAVFFLTKENLSAFLKAIPFWGIVFFAVVLFVVNLKQIDFADRATISEVAENRLNSISISRYSAMIFIPSFIIALFEKEKRNLNFVCLAVAAVSFFFLFLSAQRGTLIGVALALVLFFLLNINRKNKVRYLVIFILVVSFFWIVFANNWFGLYDRFVGLESFKEMPRFYDYGTSWGIFKKNDFFFGEGSLGYYYLTGREYPHNFVLESMVEYGLFGLLLSISILICGFVYSFKILRNKNIHYIYKAVPLIWISQAFSILVSSSILGGHWVMVFSSLLALEYKLISDKQFSFEKNNSKYKSSLISSDYNNEAIEIR